MGPTQHLNFISCHSRVKRTCSAPAACASESAYRPPSASGSAAHTVDTRASHAAAVQPPSALGAIFDSRRRRSKNEPALHAGAVRGARGARGAAHHLVLQARHAPELPHLVMDELSPTSTSVSQLLSSTSVSQLLSGLSGVAELDERAGLTDGGLDARAVGQQVSAAERGVRGNLILAAEEGVRGAGHLTVVGVEDAVELLHRPLEVVPARPACPALEARPVLVA